MIVLINPFKMLQKCNIKCAGTINRWAIMLGNSIIELLDQKWIHDVQIICGNSEVLTSSRWLVAMSYPSLYNVILEMEGQEEITLLLPEFRKSEVLLRMTAFLTGTLTEAKVGFSSYGLCIHFFYTESKSLAEVK